MNEMNTKLILAFLEDLSKNNNREWFHANKPRYEEAKAEFEKFVEHIILSISKFDKEIKNISAKDCLFRIYNDVRFAKNKPLYKKCSGDQIPATPLGNSGGVATSMVEFSSGELKVPILSLSHFTETL